MSFGMGFGTGQHITIEVPASYCSYTAVQGGDGKEHCAEHGDFSFGGDDLFPEPLRSANRAALSGLYGRDLHAADAGGHN